MADVTGLELRTGFGQTAGAMGWYLPELEPDESTSITVAFMDPAAVLQLVNRDDIGELAQEVRARLERVKSAIS